MFVLYAFVFRMFEDSLIVPNFKEDTFLSICDMKTMDVCTITKVEKHVHGQNRKIINGAMLNIEDIPIL